MNTSTFKTKILSWLKNPAGDIWLLALVLILLNLVAVRAFVRIDLTAQHSYSLTEASRNLVKNAENEINVKVFFSKNLRAPYSSVYQYVEDLLSEYKTADSRHFSYELFDMSKPENESLALEYGLTQLQIRELKNNEVGFKNVFMGLVISYADQIQVLDGLTSSESLEYKITSAIGKAMTASDSLLGLTGPVNITLYRSQNLEPLNIEGFADLSSLVNAAVENLNKKYGERLFLETVNPRSEDIPSLHETYGLPSIPIQSANGSYSYGTLALLLQSGQNHRAIPFSIGQSIDLFRGAMLYSIQGLDTLEEDIDSNLQALSLNVTSIAYTVGHDEVPINDAEQGASYLYSQIQDRYALKELNLLQDEIPLGVNTVIVNGPRSEFSDAELYKLDQFLMRGGNLMLFLDPFSMGQNQYYPEYTPIKTGLEKLLAKYGIQCESEYVMDKNCAVSYDNRTGQEMYTYYIPVLQKESLSQKNPITQNLGDVGFIIPGSIDVSAAQENKDVNVTVLASSSTDSWAVSEDIQLNPAYIQVPYNKAEFEPKNLSVLLEGKFTSSFEKKPQIEGEEENANLGENHLEKSILPGKIMVTATSYITGPDIAQGFFSRTVLFLQNAIDYLNGNEDLCLMRTKGLSTNALKNVTSLAANIAKYTAEVGLALLVAVAAVIMLILRKKHRATIRMEYDPTDDRETLGSKKRGGKN